MSKIKKGVIILLAMFSVFIVFNILKEDKRIKLEKEIIIDDLTFTGSVLYENKKFSFFHPSPENKFECEVEFTIKTEGFTSTKNQVILSDENPIQIEDIFLLKIYEDKNISLFDSYLSFYLNGNKSNEKMFRNSQSLILFKHENYLIAYDNYYSDLIEKLNSAGYQEYDLNKMEQISNNNMEKWNNMLDNLK